MKRFWDRVEKTDGCWNWTGAVNNTGYGILIVGSRTDGSRRCVMAHRWVMNQPKCQVLHHCDNRLCVNPDHLYLGTNSDNVRDRVDRDRSRGHLTREDVLEIRSLQGKMLQREIAKQFNCSRGHVGDIHRRTKWRHI
jgi:hypothetical protein